MDEDETIRLQVTRRAMLEAGTAATALLFTGFAQATRAAGLQDAEVSPTQIAVVLRVNSHGHTLTLDPRTTLLDALREHLALTVSKKGCDHGQCGACTVLLEGRRINSCLTLAVLHDGQAITTIEGLADGATLHPLQAAFVEHDGFQCGYCRRDPSAPHAGRVHRRAYPERQDGAIAGDRRHDLRGRRGVAGGLGS